MEQTIITPLGKNGRLTAIDLFCGAGGVTQGLLDSEMIQMEVAINHSPEAIAAHKKNNPDVIHMTEDIRDISRIFPHLPKKVNILWASAECTHFSVAKGGQNREADSRSLADDLVDYVIETNPDYFITENVREFRTWGPLIKKRTKDGQIMYDRKTKKPIMVPDPERKGVFYKAWVRRIKSLGYEYQYKDINAADHGVPTSRIRYFGVFAKTGLKIAFPEQTHAKDPKPGSHLEKWVPCRDFLELENEGKSIFGRKKPLVPKTLARIAYGMRKYCLNDFIAQAYGTLNANSLDEALKTITVKDRHAKVSIDQDEEKRQFLAQHLRINMVGDVEEPLRTVITKDEKHLVTAKFLNKQQYDEKRAQSLNEPVKAITTKGRDTIVSCKFLQKSYGSNGKPCNAIPIEKPLGTIAVNDKHALISSKFILKKESGLYNSHSLEKPLSTIVTKDFKGLVSVDRFISSSYSGGGKRSGINEPLPTITAANKHALITVEKKNFFVEHLGVDEDVADLLAEHIVDIKMRYLNSSELANVTGFHKDAALGNTETIRKKHIGNAVPPRIPKLIAFTIVEANLLNIAI